MATECSRRSLLPPLLVACACIVLALLPAAKPGAIREQGAVREIPALLIDAKCGEPVTLIGTSELAGGSLKALTNALIQVPACPWSQTLVLSGTEARGMGPALSVARLAGEVRVDTWSGVVSATQAVEIGVPQGQSALLSYTNDIVWRTEDRNLTVIWRAK